MATHKPLVEFFATVRSSHKGTNRTTLKNIKNEHDPSLSAQQLVVTLVLTDPEDIRAMDDFTSGPMGVRVVAFRAMPPDALKRQRCDPNQLPSEEAAPEDELARLRAQHVVLLKAMTTQDVQPPSDAATS